MKYEEANLVLNQYQKIITAGALHLEEECRVSTLEKVRMYSILDHIKAEESNIPPSFVAEIKENLRFIEVSVDIIEKGRNHVDALVGLGESLNQELQVIRDTFDANGIEIRVMQLHHFYTRNVMNPLNRIIDLIQNAIKSEQKRKAIMALSFPNTPDESHYSSFLNTYYQALQAESILIQEAKAESDRRTAIYDTYHHHQ